MQENTLTTASVSARATEQKSRTRRTGFGRLRVFAVPALLLIGWIATTEITHTFLPNQVPPPSMVLSTARDLLMSGDLWKNVSASTARVLLGFVIGSGAALLAGTLVGLSRTVEQLIDPTLQAMRNVPSLAWVPFLLLWMGIDEAPKVTLVAIGCFFPVYLNAVSGIRQADRKLIEVGYIFGLSDLELVRRIILPAGLPYLTTGLRVGMGQGWLFLVAAELIASTRGLGFMLIDGQNSSRPDIMVVSILILALLGKLFDGALRAIERRLLHWTDTFQGK
jgi:sulfonate transport system permease protein